MVNRMMQVKSSTSWLKVPSTEGMTFINESSITAIQFAVDGQEAYIFTVDNTMFCVSQAEYIAKLRSYVMSE